MAERVTVLNLRDWIKNGKSVAIIDVRDDDHAGGNIVGSKHFPSSKFATSIPEVIQHAKDKDAVVFHCSLSQLRGPKAARMYLEAYGRASDCGDAKAQKVYVLEGGFVNWEAQGYGSDPSITQDYDAKAWQNGYMY